MFGHLPTTSQAPFGSSFTDHVSHNMAHPYLVAEDVTSVDASRYPGEGMCIGGRKGGGPWRFFCQHDTLPRKLPLNLGDQGKRAKARKIREIRAFMVNAFQFISLAFCYRLFIQIFMFLLAPSSSVFRVEAVEDSLDLYSHEWEQFTVEDATGELWLDYLDLIHSGIVDYAKAPVVYFPYPIVVNEELINHITSLPRFGNEIDLREEVRSMGKEVILQKLYPRWEEVDVWNKSNGFIINQITNEGAKWAARILTRRLVGIEVSTYFSHQWATVVAKLAEGIVYSWASWIVDIFKEHCLALQMSRRNFPMPSLLVVMCMEALGPPRWIQPNETPRLNSYSRLKKKKKGDIRGKGTNAYLGKIYLTIQLLNDGLERMVNAPDDRRPVLVWPHSSWLEHTILAFILKYTPSPTGTSPKNPTVLAWSPSNLPTIPLLEVQEKDGTIGREKKNKKKPTIKEPKSLKRKLSEVDFEQETSKRERKRYCSRVDNEDRRIRTQASPSGSPGSRGEEHIESERQYIIERDWLAWRSAFNRTCHYGDKNPPQYSSSCAPFKGEGTGNKRGPFNSCRNTS
eukprot:Gb_27845 [translate_table: standard]